MKTSLQQAGWFNVNISDLYSGGSQFEWLLAIQTRVLFLNSYQIVFGR